MTEVIEAESLTRFKSNSHFDGGGAILAAVIMLALSGVMPFSFVDGKIQSSGFA
jgi:hypothetical protein